MQEALTSCESNPSLEELLSLNVCSSSSRSALQMSRLTE